ncbi:MAG TPA: 30S ribosomal protein S6 [Pseudobdellovibrionaceae bacterium]|nr:30S ribosomal protein S6 [Pseudobdellovibrionaceae bacterium]
MDNKLLKRPYEVVVILHPDTNINDQKEIFKKNKETIEAHRGTVHSLETWGKRNLSNIIKKQKKGLYYHSFFEGDPQMIMELERVMRINDKVLRYMHTRLDERISLAKHMEAFKKGLQDTAAREKEREARIQAKRAQAKAERFEQA